MAGSLLFTRRNALIGAGSLVAAGARSAIAADAAPMRFGFVPVIGAAALFVVDGAGWAREAGLQLKTNKFDSGPAAIQAFASGSLDALAIGVAPVAVARSKGLDVSVVTAAGLGGSAFVASPELAAQFRASGKNTAAAFSNFRKATGRRAKLATLPPGGVPTVALHYWLNRANHVDPADVEIVSIGIEAAQLAMLSGSVDGATLLEPSATVARARNPKLEVIATARDMMPGVPGVVFAFSAKAIAERRADVARLVALVERATKLVKEKPAEAAPHVAAALGGGLVDPALMVAAMTSPAVEYVVDPHAIVEPTRALLAYEAEIGDFAKAPPTENLFDFSFWDALHPR